MKSKLLKIFAGLVLLLILLALFNIQKIKQLYTVLHIFDEDQIVYNFMHMEELFDTRTIERSPQPTQLVKIPTYQPITSFTYEDYQLDEVAYDSRDDKTDFKRYEPIVFYAEGSSQSILKAERLVLNAMQRMSAIATKTRQFVDLLEGTQFNRSGFRTNMCCI